MKALTKIVISVIVYITCITFVHCDDDEPGDFANMMRQYERHPLFQKIKNQFYAEHGDKSYTVLEKMKLLKEILQNFYDITNRKEITYDLKIAFKTGMNELKPDFDKLNYSEADLKDRFKLKDSEATAYRVMYSEAEQMFNELDKRFLVEADC